MNNKKRKTVLLPRKVHALLMGIYNHDIEKNRKGGKKYRRRK